MSDTDAPAKTAPRSPEQDGTYDCLNDANREAKLANDIAISGLKSAKAKFDAAVKDRDDSEKTILEKAAEVSEVRTNIALYEQYLENARKRTP